MGIQDLDRLNELARYANSFPGYKFIMDTDTRQSRNLILLSEFGMIVRPPISKERADELRSQGFRPFVPDLMDYKAKLIIEYQEESKPQKGPKIVKRGHDEFSDEDKDLYYQLAGFKQLKIWESDIYWMEKIQLFLSQV